MSIYLSKNCRYAITYESLNGTWNIVLVNPGTKSDTWPVISDRWDHFNQALKWIEDHNG